jgi:hypothetical protein
MDDLALYLQTLAFAIDTDLDSIRNGLRGALNRPTALWTRTTDLVLAVDSSTFGFSYESLVFSNYPNAFDNGVSPRPPIGVAGWYRFGFYGRITQAAAVVVGTTRDYAQRINSQGLSTVFSFTTDYFQDTTMESNTGGENLQCEGTVYLPALTDAQQALTRIESSVKVTLGGGGAVSLKAGCILFLTYLGAGDLVRVVT